MLVLKWVPGKMIYLTGGIVLHCLPEKRKGECQIGIEAPASIRVMRGEVVAKLQQAAGPDQPAQPKE